MRDERVEKMELFAWVGEDELGSGEMGLKQAMVPAGCIAIVACKKEKVSTSDIILQLRGQASKYGKTIRLCRFVYKEDLIVIEP